jgi:hypothetical protein
VSGTFEVKIIDFHIFPIRLARVEYEGNWIVANGRWALDRPDVAKSLNGLAGPYRIEDLYSGIGLDPATRERQRVALAEIQREKVRHDIRLDIINV